MDSVVTIILTTNEYQKHPRWHPRLPPFYSIERNQCINRRVVTRRVDSPRVPFSCDLTGFEPRTPNDLTRSITTKMT